MSDTSIDQAVLMLADIGGYTSFMLDTRLAVEHSHEIISQLIRAIIAEIKIPLKLAKLEGDAVFLYARKTADPDAWNEARQDIGAKLLQFFTVFHRKLEELAGTDPCDCGACGHIDALRLKIIVHSGKAVFYRIEQFDELSGGDVILTHRLLKNSVPLKEYILMTEPAYADIAFPLQLPVHEGSEHYEHLGQIKTLFCEPLAASGTA
ncbi:MAG: DUF2652 domain-containing protein [Nitrospirota bacterium]|jgi:hypothetical protein